jgi:hypothetical protein
VKADGVIRTAGALLLTLAMFAGMASHVLAAEPTDDATATFVRSTPSSNAPTPGGSSLSSAALLSQLATLAGFPFGCPLHVETPPPTLPASN